MIDDPRRWHELGLGPRWRSRRGAAVPAPEPDAAPAEAPPQAVPEVAGAPAAALRGDVAGVVGPAEVVRQATPGGDPAAPRVQAAAAPTRAGLVAEVPAGAGGARGSAIAAMGWDELAAAAAACTACPLHAGRRQAVLGVGDQAADWLFVGEGPGADEDAQGEPFVGQAGKLLDNMLRAIGLKRGEGVYIANVVKCRPPQNRTPTGDEARACVPFLARQIALIEPRVVVAMGRTAANTLLGADSAMAALRGRVHNLGGIPLIATFHPAYLLRTPLDKAKAWEDLCLARRTMGEASGRAAPPSGSPPMLPGMT